MSMAFLRDDAEGEMPRRNYGLPERDDPDFDRVDWSHLRLSVGGRWGPEHPQALRRIVAIAQQLVDAAGLSMAVSTT